ncbi:hypothetical protein CHUAL_013001 [Chamberlinius hualienensis]
MGKKDNKKGRGAEKTASKTEKKAAQKLKKDLKAKGEDDIENLIAEFQELDRRRDLIEETVCSPPSSRSSFSFSVHPDRDELILFGGELYTGKETYLYNDLYFYNIKKNEWSLIKAPNAPPPRCSHQAVTTSQCGGQLWIFGGEFASPTESQFYHYKDLWVFHLQTKKWEKINTTGGPCARSGHRMIISKKLLIVFGGFHDTIGKCKYYNDVHIFNLETYKWQKVECAGQSPPPRSACQMTALNDGRILIYGGYCKEQIKRDVDKGITYSDMYYLQPEKGDTTGTKWRWSQVKQCGIKPSPRCGFSLASVPNNNKVYLFGGVYDVEDSEEKLDGVFYNQLYLLQTDKGKWHMVDISEKQNSSQKKGEEVEEVEVDNTTEEEITSVTTDDGIFTVTIGPSIATGETSSAGAASCVSTSFQPPARMNAGIAIKYNTLFLYGGIQEVGKNTITFSDFYSLDLKKLDAWNIIIKHEEEETAHALSESSSEDEEEEDGSDKESDDEEAEDNSDEEDEDAK